MPARQRGAAAGHRKPHAPQLVASVIGSVQVTQLVDGGEGVRGHGVSAAAHAHMPRSHTPNLGSAPGPLPHVAPHAPQCRQSVCRS